MSTKASDYGFMVHDPYQLLISKEFAYRRARAQHYESANSLQRTHPRSKRRQFEVSEILDLGHSCWACQQGFQLAAINAGAAQIERCRLRGARHVQRHDDRLTVRIDARVREHTRI